LCGWGWNIQLEVPPRQEVLPLPPFVGFTADNSTYRCLPSSHLSIALPGAAFPAFVGGFYETNCFHLTSVMKDLDFYRYSLFVFHACEVITTSTRKRSLWCDCDCKDSPHRCCNSRDLWVLEVGKVGLVDWVASWGGLQSRKTSALMSLFRFGLTLFFAAQWPASGCGSCFLFLFFEGPPPGSTSLSRSSFSTA
jgi:hypothetical protein